MYKLHGQIIRELLELGMQHFPCIVFILYEQKHIGRFSNLHLMYL